MDADPKVVDPRSGAVRTETGQRLRGALRRPTAPTMRDIAEATGVSQSTVSRVLSGTRTVVPIAEDTRERVLEQARRLGYRANPLARGLRGAPTGLLGVIVRDITDPFFAGAIEAASLEADRRGYNVVLGHAQRSGAEAVALWGILEARHCDAILFLGDLRDRPGLIGDLRDTSIPVVGLWYGAHGSGIPSVGVDNGEAIATLMEHLYALGHQRIAFAGSAQLGDISERISAYRTGSQRLGLTPPSTYLVDAANDYEGGASAFDQLMGVTEPPTAIMAATDVIAIGMLRAARRRGVAVPGSVSITGFDDIPFAAQTAPALTTVRMPTEAMIATAIDLAIGPREGLAAARHRVHRPELVVRESTARASS